MTEGNAAHLMSYLLFVVVAPLGFFMKDWGTTVLDELHLGSHAVARVCSTDAKGRNIITAFETLTEKVALTNLTDVSLRFDHAINESRLVTVSYGQRQWLCVHSHGAQPEDVRLLITRGGTNLTGRDHVPEHEFAMEMRLRRASPKNSIEF